MPELPEVENVRRALERNILNKKITSVNIFFSKFLKNSTIDQFKNKLMGNQFLSVDRHAKYLILNTQNNVFISHLRMEGKYFYTKKSDLENFNEQKHVLFSIGFENGDFLFYHDVRKFGTVDIYSRKEFSIHKQLSHVAAEPWDIDFNLFFNKINKRNTEIKKTLLDQSVISGLGNIYVDEVLFKSKVSPLRKSNKVTKSEAKLLLNNSKTILKKAIEMGGTTIRTFSYDHFKGGTYQSELYVYSRAGLDCKICKNTLLKVKVGGRGTVYCKKCQL